MRIVIDTNIVISGAFFGGVPEKILDAVLDKKIFAYATKEIMEEYEETKIEMITKKRKKMKRILFSNFIENLHVIDAKTQVNVCRDPDDDKFIACAIDADALYIVSGDKDLLTIKYYDKIEIVTAKEFCERFLP